MSAPEQRHAFEDIYLRYLRGLRDYPELTKISGPPYGPDFGLTIFEAFLMMVRIARDFNRSQPGQPSNPADIVLH